MFRGATGFGLPAPSGPTSFFRAGGIGEDAVGRRFPGGIQFTGTTFTGGMEQAVEETKQGFDLAGRLLTNFAQSVGNSLTHFTDAVFDETKRFRDAMALFLRDLSRALISGVGAGLTNKLLGAFGLPGRAGGGPVRPGVPYMVGERGSELFVPDESGQIYNRRQMRGMGNISITYAPTISAFDAAGVDAVLRANKQDFIETALAEIEYKQGYSNSLTQRLEA